MSADPTAIGPLSVHERRVLGVLVEKQKTTDTYPLTLNSIVTGCNQKSNREPVLDLVDIEVEETLAGLQQRGLVMRVISGRVDKWKHQLYEAWKVNSVEIAVLAELLLRGPQTEGELRGRASRMEDIADLDALRALLIPLNERKLVVYLTPEGRRGTIVTHGFHESFELERLRAHHSSQPLDADPTPTMRAAPNVSNDETRAQVAQLAQAVDELRGEVSRLAAALQAIQKELGLSPS